MYIKHKELHRSFTDSKTGFIPSIQYMKGRAINRLVHNYWKLNVNFLHRQLNSLNTQCNVCNVHEEDIHVGKESAVKTNLWQNTR